MNKMELRSTKTASGRYYLEGRFEGEKLYRNIDRAHNGIFDAFVFYRSVASILSELSSLNEFGSYDDMAARL